MNMTTMYQQASHHNNLKKYSLACVLAGGSKHFPPMPFLPTISTGISKHPLCSVTVTSDSILTSWADIRTASVSAMAGHRKIDINSRT